MAFIPGTAQGQNINPQDGLDKDQLFQVFQQVLGRDPSDVEFQGFTQAIKNGQLDTISLGQFLQGTQEAQSSQFGKTFNQVGGALESFGQKGLERDINRGFDTAQSRFSQLGRPNSSGFQSQVGNVIGDASLRLAQQRQSQMSSLANAFFGRAQQQQLGQAGQASRQRETRQNTQAGNVRSDQEFDRDRAVFEDFFQRQQDANSRQRQSGGIQGLLGLAGGVAGGIFGGPGGRIAGAKAGSTFGQLGGQVLQGFS